MKRREQLDVCKVPPSITGSLQAPFLRKTTSLLLGVTRASLFLLFDFTCEHMYEVPLSFFVAPIDFLPPP